MQLKNKLFIVLLFILFLFLFNTDCLASEDTNFVINISDFDYGGDNLEDIIITPTIINDYLGITTEEFAEYKYIIFHATTAIGYSHNCVYLNFSKTPWYINGNDICHSSTDFIFLEFYYKWGSESNHIGSFTISSNSYAYGYGVSNLSSNKPLFSNYDIYADSTLTTVAYSKIEGFFPLPPQVVQVKSLEEVAKETLEKKEIQATLLEVLKKIVVAIVGLIGFWKAYCFLLKQLRGS